MSPINNSTCKMCMNRPKKSATTKIDALPKTFKFLLEEMSGIKFTKADLMNTVICMKCLNFLKNMENSSSRPKSNKINEAGKRKVFRLMEKKRIPAAQAIEIVLAEQRAKELLVESGIKAPNASNAVGNQQPVTNTVNFPVAAPAGPKLSGAQRKKVKILIDGGMASDAAYQLVYAASLANPSNQQGNATNQAMDMEVQNKPNGRIRRVGQRQPNAPGTLARQAIGGRNNQLKSGGNQVGKAKPTQKPPVQRVAPVKAAVEKPVQGPKGRNQAGQINNTIAASPGILLPQNIRQKNNTAGGKVIKPVKRLGATVAPRRIERPAPYNNNRQQIQSQRQQNQSQRQQNPSQRQQNPSQRQQNQSQRQQTQSQRQLNQTPRQQGQFQRQNMQNVSNFQNNQNNFNEPEQQSMSFEVGIVPINYPNNKLDDLKIDALKEAITNEILKIPQGGPLIRFLGTSSENGWLKVICADQLSRDWLAMLAERWQRAGVRMVEGNALPQPAILTFYLQGDFRSPDEILNIIDKQNNSLNSNQWRVINRESDGNGQRITVCVNEQCFNALRCRDFMVYFGLGVVELKPRRSTSDGISSANNSSSQNSWGNNGNFANKQSSFDNQSNRNVRADNANNYQSNGNSQQWGGGYQNYQNNW